MKMKRFGLSLFTLCLISCSLASCQNGTGSSTSLPSSSDSSTSGTSESSNDSPSVDSSLSSSENSSSSSASSSSSSSSVSTTALERRIEFVQDNFLGKESDYTEESFNALMDAYEKALALLEKETVTQEEIDQALEDLNTAIDSLVAKIQPSSTKQEIYDYLDEIAGNYTIEFTDSFSSETEKSYTFLFDGEGFYDVERKEGVTLYGDYYHSYTIDDGTLEMGRAILAEGTLPSFLLTQGDLTRQVSILGVSEQFTSFGMDIYGYLVEQTNETSYLIDNVNYYEWFLNLAYDRYDYTENEILSMFSKATIELEDDVLTGILYDNENKESFSFKVTQGGKTAVPELETYKSSHSVYEANPDAVPTSKVEEIRSTYEDSNYGMKIDLYSNRVGRLDQESDQTIITRYNASGSSYFLRKDGTGILSDSGNLNEFTYANSQVTLGAETEEDVSLWNLMTTLFSAEKTFTLKDSTDEYFLGELDSETKTVLEKVFDLQNYSSWAHDGMYGGRPSYGASFDQVSLSVNEEGYLTITLWSGESMIVRGVVREYQDYVIPELEKEESHNLENLYQEVKAIDNSDGTYSEESYARLQAVLTEVETYLSGEGSALQDESYYQLLENAYRGLEKASEASSYDETMDDKIHDYVRETIYEDEYSSTFRDYEMTYTFGEKTGTYIRTSSYAWDTADDTGYTIFDRAVYNCELQDGEVVLSSPAVNPNGYIYNYLVRIAPTIGNLGLLDSVESLSMMRVDNENAFYTNTASWFNFIPGLDSKDVHGAKLEVVDDKLVGTIYGSLGISLNSSDVTNLEKSYLTRGKGLATFEIQVGDVQSNPMATFLAKESFEDKEGVLNAIASIGDIVKVEDEVSGDRFIVSSDFFYDLDSKEVYIESQGRVAKVSLNADSSTGMPFTLLEDKVQIQEGEDATSLSQIKGNLFALKNLTAEDIALSGTDKLHLTIAEEKSSDIEKSLGVSATLKLMLSKNGLAIVGFSGSRAESFHTLSNTLTSSEESDVSMIGNIRDFFL